MEHILFINACVRPESRTQILAQSVLSKLSGLVTKIDLCRHPIPVLNREELAHRDALLACRDFSDPMLQYAVQFSQADTIVIAAPYWDLMFPALLKSYLEAITVCGVTFHYTENGRPATLCKAKRLIYVTTAGGPIGAFDFGFQYIRALASNFYEIPAIQAITAEGLDILGADVDAILHQAIIDAESILA